MVRSRKKGRPPFVSIKKGSNATHSTDNRVIIPDSRVTPGVRATVTVYPGQSA